MSSSRASSSSPEPEIVPVKAKKSKDKAKKVKIAHPAALPEKHARNEGDDASLAYKPPEGYVLMKHSAEETVFDWDTINDDDNLELWVVRVPDELKPKYLENVRLEVPSSSKTTRIGHVDRKSTAYDVWSLGDDGDDAQAVGGDELRKVSCLLPRRKKNGKLYQAPHAISRRLVISARPTLPTPPASSPESSPAVVHQNPTRPRHPPELLTHRFAPLGSLVPIEGFAQMDMDLDTSPTAQQASKPSKAGKTAAADGSKKKRKGDAESPKKTKKAKTVS